MKPLGGLIHFQKQNIPFFVWPRYVATKQSLTGLKEPSLSEEILAKLLKITVSSWLTLKSLIKLRKAKITPDIITKLGRLKDNGYEFERDFLSAVKK